MGAWMANVVALLAGSVILAVFALALLWRVGSWRIAPAASLTYDEGLTLFAEAPQVACTQGSQEFHLSFGGDRRMNRPGFHRDSVS